MSFIPGANVGPYRIVEQAERSGVATTYTAYQPSLGRYVTLVVVPAIDREDVSLLRQYQRQLELVLGLRHPNILTVLDHGEHLGVPFVVTEMIEAEPLADRLGAPWPLAEVVRVLRPIASALDHAHGLGIVHGDIRRSSVLLTPDGTPILSGFGLMTRPLAVPAGVRGGASLEDVAQAQPTATPTTAIGAVAQPKAPSAASAAGQAPAPAVTPSAAPAGSTPARSGPSITLIVPTVVVPTVEVTPAGAQPPATTAGAGSSAPANRTATPVPASAGSTRLPVTWRVVGDPSGRWMLDEQVRVAGRTETGASVVLFPESVDDVNFAATLNTTACQATLVFRAQDDENLLMAIYIPDGLPAPGTAGGGVWLYQCVEGLDLTIRAVRPSTVRPAGEPVRLKTVTSGPNISIFLNDEPPLQAVDTAPRPGRLGLMAYSTSGRVCEATFGDIER